MLKCDRKVTTTSGDEPSVIICKIHNMPWLKQHSNTSTHPEPNEKTKGTMLKTLPQKDKDGKYPPEKKDKRGKRKSKKYSTDVSKNIDVKYRDNEKSRGEGNKNSQAGNRDIKAPECSLTLAKSETVWDSAGNAAESLFPNVESFVPEMSEAEMIERAIKESIETACLEKYAMDTAHDEVAEKSAEGQEFEWGQVQRNLPTPEPEKESEVSDRNNNSGLHPIENLTVPGDKLRRRRWNVDQEKEDKNTGRRSEIQSKNEGPSSIDTPMVPAYAPKYIDKYGRLDGYTEKRLFMGKGARFKEQEYLKQLQQQDQQLTDRNLFSESQILSSNSSETSSDPSNTLTQISFQSSMKEAEDSQALFQKSKKPLMDLLDEACGYSQDHTENTQEFNSELEDNSQYSTQSVDQFLSKMEEISNTSQYPVEPAIVSEDLSTEKFALPTKELTTVSSEKLPNLSENSIRPLTENLSKLEIGQTLLTNNYALPTMQSTIGSEEFVDSSEAFSAQKLKQSTVLPKEKQDSDFQTKQISYNSEENSRQIKHDSYISEQTPTQSHPDSGSQSKLIAGISEETSGRTKQNSFISEQIPIQSHQYSAGVGRPIVSGANSNNYQQKRHQSSGISLNRGGYHDNNSGDRNFNKNIREPQGEYDRGSRPEQNYGKTYGRGNSSGYGPPKGDRNPHGPRGEPKRDSYRNLRYEQNPHKYGEHNSDFQKGFRDSQHSQKSGGPNRNFQKVDKNPHKFDDQNREFHGGSRGDRNSYKPDGEQKRDNNKTSTVDTNPLKTVGEYNKKENNNEYVAHSKMDKNLPVSLQDLNINAAVPKREPHSWPADVAVTDSQGTFENAVQKETKDLNEISSNVAEIPDISNFASRFSAPPPIHDFTKEMISIPPVVPSPTTSFSVAQTPHYPEINDAACPKDNLPYSPSNFQGPPGFPCLERPAMSSCVCYTSGMSFEAKYANLLLKDPLLFRLLQQKQSESFNALQKNSPIPETPENRKIQGSCPNCSCNSQSSKNFNETLNVNAKIFQSKEEERAKFELWHRTNPPPVNALNMRYPIAAQHPEPLQIRHVENAEWNAANMQIPNIPLHENPQLIPCYVDSAGNAYPVNFPMAHTHQHVQRPINLPRGEEFQGFISTGYENLQPDVQRLFHQRLMTQFYENPSGYHETGAYYDEQIQPIIARHAQQIPHIPVPFPPHKYEADIAPISRSNIVQGRPDDYHEVDLHKPPKSAGVEFNNQKANEETGQVFPSDMGVGRMTNFTAVPNKGRGRARLPQNN